MSILSSFSRGEPCDLPNSIHNLPEDDTKIYCRHSALTAQARHLRSAMRGGGVHPALFYSEEEQVPWNGHLEEPPHTVESKLEMREEYPLG